MWIYKEFLQSQTAAMWLWYSAKKHNTLQKKHILRCYDLWIYYNLLVGESNALGSMNMLTALQRQVFKIIGRMNKWKDFIF